MTSHPIVRVNELNDTNYGRWAIQIADVLEGQKLWQYVEGSKAKPTDDPAVEKTHTAYLDWCAGDANARSIIRSSLDDTTFNIISDCKTAEEMMTRIREHREPKTTSVLMTAMTEFFAAKWRDTDTASTFMANLSVLAGRINACEKGVKTTDDWIIAKTLSSLPPAYSSFVTSWSMMSEDAAKLSAFREKLQHTERASIENKAATHSIDGDALHVKSKWKPKSKPSKNTKFNGECRWCRRIGHKEAECRSKKAGKPKVEERMPNTDTGVKDALSAVTALKAVASESIVFDSGASRHLTSNLRWFSSLKKLEKPLSFRIGTDAFMSATHSGIIDIEGSVDGKSWKAFSWHDVLFCPDQGETTLFSTVFMESKGFGFKHANGRCSLYKDEKAIIGGVIHGTTYRPFIRVIPPTETAFKAQTMDVWHQRLVHIGDDRLRIMANNNLVDGLELLTSKRGSCDGCHFGRQTSLNHKSRSEIRECKPGERFHSDLCCPNVASWDKHRYFMTFKDEASGFRIVKFTSSKDRVPALLKECLEIAERETGRKAISLRSDNGLEYCNKEVMALLSEKKIIHERSSAYVKQQNGMAERENRTLTDAMRSMLYDADITRDERDLLWAEAVNTAAYVLNRVPTRVRTDVTPFESWFGKKPTVRHLKVWGSPAFVRVPDEHRKKLDAKSRKAIFVGYDSQTDKIIRVFDRDRRKVERVGDFVVEDTDVTPHIDFRLPTYDDDVSVSGEDDVVDSETDLEAEPDDEIRKKGRPKGRKNRTAEECKEFYGSRDGSSRNKTAALNAMAVAMDPVTVSDAMNRDDGNLWKRAMKDEMDSLRKNETWSLQKLPAGRDVVSCRWLFKSKTNPDGTLSRRKARLVARGFSQVYGVDYEETFSPVVRYESVRIVLSMAASLNLEIAQFDVKTAFLNGKLDEEVYMEQPEGFDDGSGRVCRLMRSLYGLKQSPRNWNARMDDFLIGQQFAPCDDDPCVYVRKTGSDLIILCLYVDDGLLFGTSRSVIDNFLKHLKSTFEITLNDPKFYVGMELIRDRDSKSISISQRGYINRVLERFGLKDSKAVASPLEVTLKLEKSAENEDSFDCPYREAIGCLIHISRISRPDIAFAVSCLSRFSVKPSATHWSSVKRVMRYLKGTIDFSLTFSGTKLDLIGFCDSDWGGELDERRLTSGYVFTLGGGPIAWSSELQKLTALSSTEAEYIALTEAVTSCVWTRRILSSLGLNMDKPTTIFVDSQGAIALTKNPEFHRRTKHIEIRYHRVRQERGLGRVDFAYVPSDDNLSDVMTKSLSGTRLERINRSLGLMAG